MLTRRPATLKPVVILDHDGAHHDHVHVHAYICVSTCHSAKRATRATPDAVMLSKFATNTGVKGSPQKKTAALHTVKYWTTPSIWEEWHHAVGANRVSQNGLTRPQNRATGCNIVSTVCRSARDVKKRGSDRRTCTSGTRVRANMKTNIQ